MNEKLSLNSLELDIIKTTTDIEKTKQSKLNHKFKAFVYIGGGALVCTLGVTGLAALYVNTQQFTIFTGLGVIALGGLAVLGTDYIQEGLRSIAKLNYQDAREKGLSLKINMLREKMTGPNIQENVIKPI